MRPFLDTTAPISTGWFFLMGLLAALGVVAEVVAQYYSSKAVGFTRQMTGDLYQKDSALLPKASRDELTTSSLVTD